jgi:hypothetical protein
MPKQFTWKVWLRPNRLTRDVENDHVAEVSTVGKTLDDEDIARAIVDEGSELQYETLLDVFRRGDRLRYKRLQQGYVVRTGLCRVAPRVNGNWPGTTGRFDPGKHKLACDFTMTAGLRRALGEVGVEVLGALRVPARVGLVTDVTTGLTDGTVTPGGDLIITGVKIKVAPVDDPGIGVFLVAADGSGIPFEPPYTVNDPKQIICRVPPAATGVYALQIVTRFSKNTRLLKAPRVIEYELPLEVL